MEPHSSSTPRQTGEAGSSSMGIRGRGRGGSATEKRRTRRRRSPPPVLDHHGFIFEKVLTQAEAAKRDLLPIPEDAACYFSQPRFGFWMALSDLSRRWIMSIVEPHWKDDEYSLVPWSYFARGNGLEVGDTLWFFRCPTEYCTYTVRILRSQHRFGTAETPYRYPNPIQCKWCESSAPNRYEQERQQVPPDTPPILAAGVGGVLDNSNSPILPGRRIEHRPTSHRFKLDGKSSTDPHQHAPSSCGNDDDHQQERPSMEPHSSSTPRQTGEAGSSSMGIRGRGRGGSATEKRRRLPPPVPDHHGFIFEKVLTQAEAAKRDWLPIPEDAVCYFSEPRFGFWVALSDLSRRWIMSIYEPQWKDDEYSLVPWAYVARGNELEVGDTLWFFRCPTEYCTYTVRILRSQHRLGTAETPYRDPNPMQCKWCESSAPNRYEQERQQVPPDTPPILAAGGDGVLDSSNSRNLPGRRIEHRSTWHRFKLDGESSTDPHQQAPSSCGNDDDDDRQQERDADADLPSSSTAGRADLPENSRSILFHRHLYI